MGPAATRVSDSRASRPNEPAWGGNGRGSGELERQAETLRRLADQLEALAEERRSSGGGTREIGSAFARDLPVRAAIRGPLTDAEAEALRELPGRLENAVRRVRLSAEILSHHLGTMSTLLHKAAGARRVSRAAPADR